MRDFVKTVLFLSLLLAAPIVFGPRVGIWTVGVLVMSGFAVADIMDRRLQ